MKKFDAHEMPIACNGYEDPKGPVTYGSIYDYCWTDGDHTYWRVVYIPELDITVTYAC